MRKMTITTLLASTLILGGCTQTGLEGLGGSNPMGGILGSVLAGGLGTAGSGYSNDDFEQAAVNACGRQASQYGQVRISDVGQTSRDSIRVDGTIAQNYQQRGFTCSFRSDGRITDFRVG